MHRLPPARRSVVVRRKRARRTAVAAVAVVGLGAGVLATATLQSQAALNPVALYVSPSGTAGAAGTAAAPTTFASALTRIPAGGTVYLRGGTYKLSSTVTVAEGNDGTSAARKEIAAYPGEAPVLDFSAQAEASANRGLQLFGDWWKVSGIVVQKAGDNGIYIGGSHNVIERVVTRFNRDTGLQLGRAASSTARADWPAYNLVTLSESHDNRDAAGENADGFAAKLTVGPGNVFRYDVAHHNIDDGWDLFAKPDTGPIDPVTIEDSLAFSNGTLSDGTQAAAGDRNGFKLGGSAIAVNHVVRRSFAVRNGKHGFTWNSNPGAIAMSDNVSVDNGQRNYAFDGGVSVFRRNTSCRTTGSVGDMVTGDADASNQWWGGSNGSRCSAYTAALGWSLTDAGTLAVVYGGTRVTPTTAAAPTTTLTAAPSATDGSPSDSASMPETATAPAPAVSATAPVATAISAAPPVVPALGTAAPATGTRLWADDFADGDSVGWTKAAGTWVVRSAGLAQDARGTAVAYAGSAAWTATDVRVTATNRGVTGAGSGVRVLARVQDATSYYALVVRDANVVELRRLVAGRNKVLAKAAFKAATNRPYALRLVVKGSTLTGFVDGVQVLTATDTTFAAGGVGVGSVNATATFDDVTVWQP